MIFNFNLMLNELFFTEKILSTTNNEYSDLESLNQICPHLSHEYIKKEEIKNNYINPLNKLKTDSIIQNFGKIANNKSSEEEIMKIFQPKIVNLEENDLKKENFSIYFINNFNQSNKNLIGKNKKHKKKHLFFSCNVITPLFNNNNNKNNLLFHTENKIDKKEEENFDTNDNKINNALIQNNEKKQSNPILLKKKRGPYKKKNLNLRNIDFGDKCFPFKTGKGIINITTKYNNKNIVPLENTDFSSIDLTDEKTDKTSDFFILKDNMIPTISILNNENEFYLMKFTTKKYYYSETGRRKRVKKKRKYKSDIIRKKIKSRFHKTIKRKINEYLKNAGSKYLFDCLPQCFIGNITKILNSQCFEFTYKDLITTDFGNELKRYRHTTKDNIKYKKNLKVLDYLEKNPEISKKSGFDIIKDIKYKDLLRNYFLSAEFEDSLIQLKNENETEEYIQSYIYRAKDYIDFYSNLQRTDNKRNIFEINNENKDEINDENYIEMDDYNFIPSFNYYE